MRRRIRHHHQGLTTMCRAVSGSRPSSPFQFTQPFAQLRLDPSPPLRRAGEVLFGSCPAGRRIAGAPVDRSAREVSLVRRRPDIGWVDAAYSSPVTSS